LGSGQTKWEAFIEATETKEDFFFFTSSKFAQFIPKYAFNETQLNQLRELVKSKLGDKAKF
jgi:YcxB-like protein